MSIPGFSRKGSRTTVVLTLTLALFTGLNVCQGQNLNDLFSGSDLELQAQPSPPPPR